MGEECPCPELKRMGCFQVLEFPKLKLRMRLHRLLPPEQQELLGLELAWLQVLPALEPQPQAGLGPWQPESQKVRLAPPVQAWLPLALLFWVP